MQFATMALSINDIITKVDDWVWGWVLIVLILAAGVRFGADRRSLRKMNPMPRPPLLGEVASSEAMMTERFNTTCCTTQLKNPLPMIRQGIFCCT